MTAAEYFANKPAGVSRYSFLKANGVKLPSVDRSDRNTKLVRFTKEISGVEVDFVLELQSSGARFPKVLNVYCLCTHGAKRAGIGVTTRDGLRAARELVALNIAAGCV